MAAFRTQRALLTFLILVLFFLSLLNKGYSKGGIEIERERESASAEWKNHEKQKGWVLGVPTPGNHAFSLFFFFCALFFRPQVKEKRGVNLEGRVLCLYLCLCGNKSLQNTHLWRENMGYSSTSVGWTPPPMQSYNPFR